MDLHFGTKSKTDNSHSALEDSTNGRTRAKLKPVHKNVRRYGITELY